RVHIHQLRIANPDWVSPKDIGKAAGSTPTDMARIGDLQLTFSIPALLKGDLLLPYVGVDDSDVNLVRDTKERANWDFSAPGAKPKQSSNEPAKFPLLGSLHLGKGHLVVVDEVRKLHFKGTVAAEQTAHSGNQSLSLNGDGGINGQPFKLTASG